MSEKLIVEPLREYNGDAVHCPNFITEQLAGPHSNSASGFLINDLKRRELMATNAMLHGNALAGEWLWLSWSPRNKRPVTSGQKCAALLNRSVSLGPTRSQAVRSVVS